MKEKHRRQRTNFSIETSLRMDAPALLPGGTPRNWPDEDYSRGEGYLWNEQRLDREQRLQHEQPLQHEQRLQHECRPPTTNNCALVPDCLTDKATHGAKTSEQTEPNKSETEFCGCEVESSFVYHISIGCRDIDCKQRILSNLQTLHRSNRSIESGRPCCSDAEKTRRGARRRHGVRLVIQRGTHRLDRRDGHLVQGWRELKTEHVRTTDETKAAQIHGIVHLLRSNVFCEIEHHISVSNQPRGEPCCN